MEQPNSNSEDEQSKEKKIKSLNENTVFIGDKPIINYIRSATIQLNKPGCSEIIIRARGKFISKAVDVSEVVKRNLQSRALYAKEIRINSEEFEKDGKKLKISTMDIVLAAKG